MNTTPAARRSRTPWLRLAGTLLTIVLLGYLLYEQGWEQIWSALQKLSLWTLLLALVLTLVSRVFVTLRWYILLHATGEPVSLYQALRLTFAGLFASNFLPTTIGGDVVRLAGAVQLRMDSAVSAASLIVDRLVGMSGMILTIPWGLERLFTIGLPALVAPEAARLPGWAMAIPFSGKLQGLWKKLLSFLNRILDSVRIWLKKPGYLALALLSTLGHQVCLFTSIWLLLRDIGEPISWWWVAGIWSLVYFITLLPVSINGYGLQEVSQVLLYSRLGGISPQASLTVALLVRTLQMAASLPGAAFVPGIIAARQEKKTSEKIPAQDL